MRDYQSKTFLYTNSLIDTIVTEIEESFKDKELITNEPINEIDSEEKSWYDSNEDSRLFDNGSIKKKFPALPKLLHPDNVVSNYRENIEKENELNEFHNPYNKLKILYTKS